MTRLLMTIGVFCLMAAVSPAAAQPPAANTATTPGRSAGAEKLHAQVFAWLGTQKIDPDTRARIEAIWPAASQPASEDELLLRLARSFALADARAAKLLALCSATRGRRLAPDESWLRGGGVPPLVSANLRLLYARWLVHESLIDEAQEQLSGLAAVDVAAPATLLFYQSVAYYALLNKEAGLKTLDELLEGAEASPRRYVALARLMREDLKGLDNDSLDHIARRMNDIGRRLGLGRAGPKVRKEEEGVIESLDKIIKKAEQQQQQQQAANDANSLQPGSPAPESRIAAGKGPGDVTKKNIGSESGWGNLPPKQREEAMQQVGRDFPAHYRDAIEQYFRRLAAEGSE